MLVRLGLLVTLASSFAYADHVEVSQFETDAKDTSACATLVKPCRPIDAVATRWGTAEVDMGIDTRAVPVTPARIAKGEYGAVYALVLPGKFVTENLREGGSPSNHPYEQCMLSDGSWCERIASTNAQLSADDRGVTLTLTTRVRRQWAELIASGGGFHGKIHLDHVTTVRIVRCTHGDGWTCTSRTS